MWPWSHWPAAGGVYDISFRTVPIEDGKLITGQNPASFEAVAKALVAQLK
jgi:putative intracellular protease/amidase